MLSIHFNGKDSGIKISRAHLPWHTPVKHGARGWKIVDDQTQEIVDSYTPLRIKSEKVITPHAGSWMTLVNQPGFMH